MTITVWPVDAIAGAPSYTGRMARQTAGALVGGKTAARPLGGTSGLIAGTGTAVVAATTTTWTVGQCAGVIDGEASTAAGPYFFSNDTNVTGSMTAADATNPRIDVISAQLSDPAEGDGSTTPGVAFVYTLGTAAASPVAPSTPPRAVAIAQINVPRSGAGSPTVSDVAPRVVGAGGVQPVSGTATRPASPYFGRVIYDQSLTMMLAWDGTKWADTRGDSGWVNITPLSGFTSSGAQVRMQGTKVKARGKLIRTAGAFPTAGTACGTLPTGFDPSSDVQIPAGTFSSSVANGMGILISSGSLTIQGYSVGAGQDTLLLSSLEFYTD